MQTISVYTLFIASILAIPALAAVKRIQICASQCETEFCKKLAEEVEFEFELSGDYLLPPCSAPKNALPKQEFRLVFVDHADGDQVLVELDCQGKHKCLSKSYEEKLKGSALVAKVVSDAKIAIKHNKPWQSSGLKRQTQDVPAPKEKAEVSEKPLHEEEWDRVVLVSSGEAKPQPEPQPMIAQEAILPNEPVSSLQRRIWGSAAISFGGENWNYSFESSDKADKMYPFHSKIYPKILFSAAYWPKPFLRISGEAASSIVSFRLKANQPVDGDGQLIIGQIYRSDLMMGLLMPIGEMLHLGIDTGYEFSGAFIDKQRIADRPVTIVPGYQNHGFRLGPRMILGAFSEKGMVDLGVGFYPYVYYFESPDEPTVSSKSFAWSIHGSVRLMFNSDIFADVIVKTNTVYVQYEQESKRENIEGEKWGPGKVTNTSTSATVGLGWLF